MQSCVCQEERKKAEGEVGGKWSGSVSVTVNLLNHLPPSNKIEHQAELNDCQTRRHHPNKEEISGKERSRVQTQSTSLLTLSRRAQRVLVRENLLRLLFLRVTEARGGKTCGEGQQRRLHVKLQHVPARQASDAGGLCCRRRR